MPVSKAVIGNIIIFFTSHGLVRSIKAQGRYQKKTEGTYPDTTKYLQISSCTGGDTRIAKYDYKRIQIQIER